MDLQQPPAPASKISQATALLGGQSAHDKNDDDDANAIGAAINATDTTETVRVYYACRSGNVCWWPCRAPLFFRFKIRKFEFRNLNFEFLGDDMRGGGSSSGSGSGDCNGDGDGDREWG